MNIIKFGGKSLANGAGIEQVLSVIEHKKKKNEHFIVVLSARGHTTNALEQLIEKTQQGISYVKEWNAFKHYQMQAAKTIDLNAEFNFLEKIFESIHLVEDCSPKVRDLVLAQGELIAIKTMAFLLKQRGISCMAVDSRQFFVTDSNFGNAQIDEQASLENVQDYFKKLQKNSLPIVSGFIAANRRGETTTLGRNAGNYSASLLASYLQATEVQNYTHVNGIHTANPELVDDAEIIKQLNYQEANELASFGTTVIHAKTITPLRESNIPLRIYNTFNRVNGGTLINKENNKQGVKSISVQQDRCIINIEGKGLLEKRGINARIFNSLSHEAINIGVISQGSSERSLGFVIEKKESEKAVTVLEKEFTQERRDKDINTISAIQDISVVTLVGQNLKGFSSSYQALTKNDIDILLMNNTINGSNISLALNNKNVNKAVNVIHSQIFGISKKINIVIFGKGTVGGSLINQILKSHDQILKRKETKLNIFALVASKKVLLNKNGISKDWRTNYEESPHENSSIQQVIDFAEQHHLENLIAIDNTASEAFTANYIPLIEAGFDIISSNKIANTTGIEFYRTLRKTLKQHNKQYLYETNVGAGLPLIDTIKLLHDSGENITKIRGVFSGSLSYLFNQFSERNEPFSTVLKEAIEKGYTEPDPREDLCGNDVARKLLILARELDLENEIEDINIDNLIPEPLRTGTKETFLNRSNELNLHYQNIKDAQEEGYVLRYVGDLYGDLQKTKGKLDVRLISVPKFSSLGQVTGADSIFEIYTQSYGDNPIVIQGAGAGAEVTARGVFGDLLRIADKK